MKAWLECGTDAEWLGGVDEVGRGPWAGPLVVCLAMMKNADFKALPASLLEAVTDSKKLTPKKRASLAASLKELPIAFHLKESPAPDIDMKGIGEENKRLYKECEMTAKNAFLCMDHVGAYKTSSPLARMEAGMEEKSFMTAAASIYAKEYRDELMRNLAETYPGYGWERNAGYGTKAHELAIISLGITPEHRRSFLRRILSFRP